MTVSDAAEKAVRDIKRAMGPALSRRPAVQDIFTDDCKNDQQSECKNLPRRRDAEEQVEIIAECPERLEPMIHPDPAGLEKRREEA